MVRQLPGKQQDSLPFVLLLSFFSADADAEKENEREELIDYEPLLNSSAPAAKGNGADRVPAAATSAAWAAAATPKATAATASAAHRFL